MSFKMLKEAQARIALGKNVTVADQVKNILGEASVDTLKSIFVEAFDESSYQITPADYSEWLQAVIEIAAEDGIAPGRKTDFMQIAMDRVLDNDPKFDALGGDTEQLKSRVAATLWQTFKASKAHQSVQGDVNGAIKQAQEEEEAIASMRKDIEDEESGGFAQTFDSAKGIDSAEEEEVCPHPVGSLRAALWQRINKKEPQERPTLPMQTKEEEEDGELDVDMSPNAGESNDEPVDDLASRIMGDTAGFKRGKMSDDESELESRLDNIESRVQELETEEGESNDESSDDDTLDIDYDSLGTDRGGAAGVIGVSIPASGKQKDVEIEDEEEAEKNFFRKAITSPRDSLTAAVRDVENEGASAWKGLNLPKNPHPKKTQAFRAWDKGMKNAARDALGLKDKPAVVPSRTARRK